MTYLNLNAMFGADLILKREDTRMKHTKDSPCIGDPAYENGVCIQKWGSKVYQRANCTNSKLYNMIWII